MGKALGACWEVRLNTVALELHHVSKSFGKVRPVHICNVIYLQPMLHTCGRNE